MTLVRFPSRRAAAIFICAERNGDGWLVLAPRGHGWLHGSQSDALENANWLARNHGGLPIRITADAP